jgi:hypothetical protein
LEAAVSLTLDELKERLSMLDEITLLELLNIHSDELVERFEDLIEDKQDKLEKEINDYF